MTNKEELKRFAEIAGKDKDFCENFTAAVKAKNADEAVRLAAEKGFTLKPEDFNFDGVRELDDEELEHVAGGNWKDNCDIDAVKAFCVMGGGIAFWAR